MGPSLVTAFCALAGEHDCMRSKIPRFLQPTREELRLAELYHAHRAQISDPAGVAGQGLLQCRDAFFDASRLRVDMPQGRQRNGGQVGDVPLLGESDRTLERRDRPHEFSAEALKVPEIQTGPDEAEGVIDNFSEPDSLLSMLASLVERSKLGEGARQEGACHHRRVCKEAKALTRQIPGQHVQQCPAKAFGSAIVARERAQPDAVVRSGNLERDIAERGADGLDLFGELAHVARAATRGQEKAAPVTRHRCQSALIVELPGKVFSFPEIPFDPSPFHQRE